MGSFKRPSAPTTCKVTSTDVIANGDLLKWDTGTGTAKRLVNEADYASFIGVAEGQIPIASNIDNVTGLENSILVREDGVFLFKTTSGETYVHGIAVTMGADNQTVSLDGSSHIIGYVFLPDGSTIVGTAARELVPVRLYVRYPAAKLG